MRSRVLFIQGAGAGAHSVDLELATSLGQALGSNYELHCPRMPNEEDPDLSAWKKKISSELSLLSRDVLVVAHLLGGSAC